MLLFHYLYLRNLYHDIALLFGYLMIYSTSCSIDREENKYKLA